MLLAAASLESTYAARYTCVKDIFRVVFFYSCYNLALATLFGYLSYAHSQHHDRQAILAVEHIFGYLIACRGFFNH